MTSNTHSLRRSVALAVIVSAIAAPAAWAGPIEPADPNGSNYQRPPSAYNVERLPPASEPVIAASDGFDWGDAGIGATAMLALAAIAAGATLATGHGPHHSRHTIA